MGAMKGVKIGRNGRIPKTILRYRTYDLNKFNKQFVLDSDSLHGNLFVSDKVNFVAHRCPQKSERKN
jgi:hypothetical protein